MTQFVPNTYVALFQEGTVPDGEDSWGNPVPAGNPTVDLADVANVPALLTEYGQSGQTGSATSQPASGRQDTVHRYRLRLRPRAVAGLTLTARTRVLDQRTGLYYLVDEVPLPGSTVQAGDVQLVLHRVS